MRADHPSPFALRIGPREYDLTYRTLVMGIVNRTPDSFYDRGKYFDLDRSVARAEQLIAEGADIIDIGGVKAGPGPFVTPEEEIDRVCPAIEALRGTVPISVDTFTAAVADAACRSGAEIINDISGLGDSEMASVAARHDAAVVITHIQGRPRVANPEPRYEDLLRQVRDFLKDRTDLAISAGVDPRSVIVDAGLDLGKSPSQSLTLLRETRSLLELGYPVLLSSSNKRFLGEVLGLEIGDRVEATAATVAYAVAAGARIVRVHEVGHMARVAATVGAILAS